MLGIVGCLLIGCDGVNTVKSMPMPAAKLNVDAAKLPNTLVTPVLDAPIPDGVNVIWCASFQLAWDELPGVTISEPMFASLNRPVVTKADVNDADVVACAGSDGQSLKRKVRRELAAKFGEGAATPLLEQWQPSPGVSFYAYMRMSMPFEYAFDSHSFQLEKPKQIPADSAEFAGPHYEQFGIPPYTISPSRLAKMRQQVRIIWHQFVRNESGRTQHFVVELKTRSRDYRLLLAAVPAHRTLEQAIDDVRDKLSHPNDVTLAEFDVKSKAITDDASTQGKQKHQEPDALVSRLAELRELELFEVPVLDFDLKKRYDELVGQWTSAGPIVEAMQRIRFKLDRTGATLESDGSIQVFGSRKREFVFRPPYLVLIVSAKTSKPILACWIGNAELLTPEQPAAEKEPAQRLFPDPAP